MKHDTMPDEAAVRHDGRPAQRTFPSDRIPSGWFQIGWSTDFPVGQPRPLRYFGCDLVAYRGESDGVHLLDAYCRHMGAHLGHGSTVEGDCVRCPYHGWRYDAQGHCVETPGGEHELRVSLGVWPIAEVDGLVLAYHDPTGEPPEVHPPPGFVPAHEPMWAIASSTRVWPAVAMAPQFAADNVLDAAHFTYIHRAPKAPVLRDFAGEGGRFSASYDVEFGAGMPTTWATPRGAESGSIAVEAWGLGVLWNHLAGFDDVRSVLGVTPITPSLSDVRVTVWVPRTRGDGSVLDERMRDRWISQQHSQVEADLGVWAHQTFVDKPPYNKGEARSLRAFRAWSHQFYA